MKIVTMIPARLGSTRVKNKNIRLLDSKPLVQHIIDSAKSASLTGEIYLNSESKIFEEIALENNINFYKRNPKLSSDEATNDDFSLDFMNNIDCDVLLQLLPTSPFVTSEQIDNFLQAMIEGNFQTMISTANVQIEATYKGNPINFDQRSQTPPSQLLTPIEAYACGLMAWDCNKFRENMKNFNSAYHGGDGSIGSFGLKGFSTVDIDNEEDFILAEAIADSLKQPKQDPEYYQAGQKTSSKEISHEEVDVPSILLKDGVAFNDLFDVNKEVVNIKKILKDLPSDGSFSKRVVDSESNSMTVIGQMPGEGNRRHFHPDWNEWWYIYQGQWDWEIEGEVNTIHQGDIVFMEKNRVHKITASGDQQAIRFAVSRSDVVHTYVDKD